ncbi:hypothetical protein Bca4012_083917 [Brassica carinata]
MSCPTSEARTLVSLIISESKATKTASVSSEMVNSTRYLTTITMRHGIARKFTVQAGVENGYCLLSHMFVLQFIKPNVGYLREAATFGLAHTVHVNEDSPRRSFLEHLEKPM